MAVMALLVLASGAVFASSATTYAEGFVGKTTASGTVYRHEKPIVASNAVPKGSLVAVSYKGRTVYGVVEDRMHRRYGRERIDLSRSLWNRLSGRAKPSVLRGVTVRVIRLP